MQGAINTECADNGLDDVGSVEQCQLAKIALGYPDAAPGIDGFVLTEAQLPGYPLCSASNDVSPYDDEKTYLYFNTADPADLEAASTRSHSAST